MYVMQKIEQLTKQAGALLRRVAIGPMANPDEGSGVFSIQSSRAWGRQ
jgi:hypothetical protein